MAFLIEEELKTVATLEVINLITQNEDSIVETIIDESIDLFSSYLYKYYDTEALFSAEGEERSKTLLKYLKDVVIYEIYIRRSRDMNEVAQIRYDEAMTWLDKVAKGVIAPKFPKKQEDTDGDGEPDTDVPFMKLGGRKSYKNHW